MSQSVAVFYKRDGFDTDGTRLLGRHAAGEGFLKALIRYGTAEPMYCYTSQRQEFDEFCDRVRPWLTRSRSIDWLSDRQPQLLAQAGTFYRPDAAIVDLAWQRRFLDQRGYSICGLTHTIASKDTLKMIGDLLTAPVQPWDALICTSTAVKIGIDRLLDHWAEYLAQRVGSRPQTQIQLPVIPLGVNCDEFDLGDNTDSIRTALRQQLGIGAEDVVALYMGRMIFYAKAHPIPMYLALEQAAKSTQTKVHLIQAGWFEDKWEEEAFIESAKRFCPSVNVIFVDGRQREVRTKIWSAADLFISLADNIQETFGLTPIEAMAAGLPVVVSDWNGYRDTVRHEVDGFLIPTITPPIGAGEDLAAQYFSNTINYSTYVGQVSISSAIDVNACAHALEQLITQPELRQKLGANGRHRARTVYDWQHIVVAYEALWAELTEHRIAAQMVAPVKSGQPKHPLCDDPFRQFAHYPTTMLTRDLVVEIGSPVIPELLAELGQNRLSRLGSDRRLSAAEIANLLQELTDRGARSIGEIVKLHPDRSSIEVMTTVSYLLKFNLIQIQADR
jgi:alpha-maltose-1-phosphate synthase